MNAATVLFAIVACAAVVGVAYFRYKSDAREFERDELRAKLASERAAQAIDALNNASERYFELRTFDVTELQAMRNETAKFKDQLLAKFDRNEASIKAALAETKSEYSEVRNAISSVSGSRAMSRRTP